MRSAFPPHSSVSPFDWPTLLGHIGAAAIIIAYFLNQSGRLASDDWRFPAANLLGSALVLVSLMTNLNVPSVVIEVFWSSISIYGMWRTLRLKGSAHRP
jgi:hypothetical protein